MQHASLSHTQEGGPLCAACLPLTPKEEDLSVQHASSHPKEEEDLSVQHASLTLRRRAPLSAQRG